MNETVLNINGCRGVKHRLMPHIKEIETAIEKVKRRCLKLREFIDVEDYPPVLRQIKKAMEDLKSRIVEITDKEIRANCQSLCLIAAHSLHLQLYDMANEYVSVFRRRPGHLAQYERQCKHFIIYVNNLSELGGGGPVTTFEESFAVAQSDVCRNNVEDDVVALLRRIRTYCAKLETPSEEYEQVVNNLSKDSNSLQDKMTSLKFQVDTNNANTNWQLESAYDDYKELCNVNAKELEVKIFEMQKTYMTFYAQDLSTQASTAKAFKRQCADYVYVYNQLRRCAGETTLTFWKLFPENPRNEDLDRHWDIMLVDMCRACGKRVLK